MTKVLIIDDDEDTLEVSKIYLTAKGYTVFTREDGMNVVEYICENEPHLVLMDIILRGYSGIILCKMVKKHLPDLPIILFSALTKNEETFLESGANGYLAKPFELPDLIFNYHWPCNYV